MRGRERFLAACRGQRVDGPPVWIMRQAGRYLPEYQAVRAKHDFLEVCRTPALAAEVTLQPLRRFAVDAAIIFSDILVVPDALGQTVTYPEGGPRMNPPIRTAADLDKLARFDPADALGYVAEALQRVRAEIGDDHALLGFSGAPFTLATYMIEGGGSKHHAETKRVGHRDPALFADLLALLSEHVGRFLRLQLDAGADAVQLFDTWAGDLAAPEFDNWALQPSRRAIEILAPGDAPVTYFVNGIAPHLERALETGATILGIDWRLELAEARRRTGAKVALQGNVDPLLLEAEPAVIRARVEEIHAQMAAAPPLGEGPGHIFNLGHGVLPFTPIPGVAAFVEAVVGLRDGGASGT